MRTRKIGLTIKFARTGVALVTCAVMALSTLTSWWVAGVRAEGLEYLLVPSAAMGRDIPVAFQAGGPHAAILLDTFNSGDAVSNWVTAASAMNSFAGSGISVAAPAGGAWSLYTNWEQDDSRQWETFLSSELPDWLAANKSLAPGGHAIIGAGQGGTGAMMMATFHPDRYRYAGSLSGFLALSHTEMNGAITAGLLQWGGADTRSMWGLPQLGRWKWHDPDAHVQLLADNNIRLWVFSPSTSTCSNPAAMIGYCDQAQGSNKSFTTHYRAVGGHNGHFDVSSDGQHDWDTWSSELAAMTSDVAATIK